MYTVLWHGRELTSMHSQVRGYPTLQLHHNGAMVEAYRGADRFAGLEAHLGIKGSSVGQGSNPNQAAASLYWSEMWCAGGRSLGDLKDYVISQKSKLLSETVA